MTWSKDLVTGIDIVDQQHHGLVDMINTAARLVLDPAEQNEAEFDRLFADLLDYADLHFRTEEGMMQAHRIDPRILAHHRLTHAGFVEQVTKMAGQFKAGTLSGEDLLGFLA